MHAREAGLVMERLQHARERDRAAVRVRDDAVAVEGLHGTRTVHFRDDERIAVDEPVGRRLVDADRSGASRDGHERAACGGSD